MGLMYMMECIERTGIQSNKKGTVNCLPCNIHLHIFTLPVLGVAWVVIYLFHHYNLCDICREYYRHSVPSDNETRKEFKTL